MPESNHQILTVPSTFADKFVLGVGRIFGFITLSTVAVAFVYSLWIGWAFTARLRELLDSAFWSIFVYVVATAFVFAWGAILQRHSTSLLLGRPAFGELGGLGTRTLSAAIRARAHVKVELHERDQDAAKRFNVVQYHALHDTLKDTFEQINESRSADEGCHSQEWDNIWEHKILDTTFDGQSLRNLIDVNRFGGNYVMSTLMRSTFVLPFVAILCWISVLVLIYAYTHQKLELLTCVQVGLLLTFLLAAFWHIFVLHNLSAYPMTFKVLPIPNSTREDYEEDIAELEGKEIRPKKIQVKKEFYKIVRNYQVRLLSISAVADIGLLLLLLGVGFGIIYIIDAEYARSLIHFHAVFAYGLLIAGFGLVLSFYIFSIVLENFQKTVSVLFLALLSAGLPFAIDFLLGGELDLSGARDAIIAGSGGLSVALVTAITSQVKESIESP